MSNDQMFARVILASTSALAGVPTLYTLHLRYPRIFHAELMTHRVFSRNARSSRAVPIMTMIKEVWGNPFVPWHWGKNQKGMQANEEISGWRRKLGRKVWVAASKAACVGAYALHKLGFHKQIANRLLEPFSYIDVLVSSTDWANFLHLRDHADAEPHFHDLAALIREAIDFALNASHIELYRDGIRRNNDLQPGVWHLPYIGDMDICAATNRAGPIHDEREWLKKRNDLLLKISVARCARISYTPFDGNASIDAELERYEKLVGSSPLHASPAEHQATPDQRFDHTSIWVNSDLSGNFAPGWIQYRKTLPGEYVQDLAA